MQRFAVGNAVSLEIAYVDYNGDPVTPTAVSYTISDETDEEIAGPIAIAGPYTDKAVFTVDAAHNAVAGGRLISLKMTTASGDVFVDAVYQLRAEKRLVVLENSFQTYLQAQLLANDMINLVGWEGATEDQRIFALEEAFRRLTEFGYLIRWPEYVDTQNIYLQDMHARITPQMWPVMTAALFEPYPATFRQAIAKAQIIEANAILTSDPIGDKRRAGISMEKVGESTTSFRAGIRPLELGIHRDTLQTIRNYIQFRMTITRAV